KVPTTRPQRGFWRALFTTWGARAGRGRWGGGGVPSCCVPRSLESPPCGRRTGRGGPTPPERTPPPTATRPGERGEFVKSPGQRRAHLTGPGRRAGRQREERRSRASFKSGRLLEEAASSGGFVTGRPAARVGVSVVFAITASRARLKYSRLLATNSRDARRPAR